MPAVPDPPDRDPELLGELLPCRFGDYVLLRQLAVGGMAEVFLAKRALPAAGYPEKLVVVKRILPQYGARPEFVRMFRDEAHLAARLSDHPNVVPIYELGSVGRSHFMSMQFVDGEDLFRVHRASVAAGESGVPLPVLCRIFADLCAGLHHAHTLRDERGVPLRLVHRDVSPQNVIVSYAGATKVLDFGVAQAAIVSRGADDPGMLKGKVAYASPEQSMGLAVDHRTDVFAAGTCFWELACGQRLWRRSTDQATMAAVLDEQAPPPSRFNPALPGEVDLVAARALEKDPRRRYQSAAHMQRDVEALAALHGVAIDDVAVGKYLRVLFAGKLAARERLVREQHVDSFEKLLLAERTETVPMGLITGFEIDWDDVFVEGAFEGAG
ncbi:MAG TPA: serine/threonine-protein kinase [Myxococcota bacterium]|jgi:serine/threonine protein kinase|nr:serine/threonine-protein kinase [Myxococcota bacterium]